MVDKPDNKKSGITLFATEDDPLLQDLSSALMSEKPEEHLNFKVISKGLGLHDLKKASPVLSKEKGNPITFNVSEVPEESFLKATLPKKGLSFFILRLGAVFIDGIIIFTIALLFHNFSLLILLGDFSKKSLDLVASVFPIFFNIQSVMYFGVIFILVWITCFLAYQSITGSTIGKMICGLKLTRRDGARTEIGHILTFRTQVVSDL